MEVNIIIGRFQPLTKGHIKGLEQVYKDSGRPSIIVMIDTPESKLDSRHPFPSDTLIQYYKEMLAGTKYVLDIITAKNANIIPITKEIADLGHKCTSLVCGTDRYASYQRMATNYLADLATDHLDVIEIPRTDSNISATKMREALTRDDKKFFAKYTPMDLRFKLRYFDDYYNTLRSFMQVNVK